MGASANETYYPAGDGTSRLRKRPSEKTLKPEKAGRKRGRKRAGWKEERAEAAGDAVGVTIFGNHGRRRMLPLRAHAVAEARAAAETLPFQEQPDQHRDPDHQRHSEGDGEKRPTGRGIGQRRYVAKESVVQA